ncbi:THUMP domain protein [Aspergillus sclerotialis]|uniref:THUMP domain protein n=1 Tax=Aspergillus sclerotialis TaxID=2070753 RepID=A0A3A2ZHF5_9EURO|nr:THUMP domain protein [Aspergillus sclerotialis]
MPDNNAASAAKRKKGNQSWRKPQGQIETGDSGVFVTCDMGREGKCTAEVLDIFSQAIEERNDGEKGQESEEDEDDIEAQIRKEVEGLKPGKDKPRKFQSIKVDVPCLTFVRLDKSIDPVELTHRLCVEARANPEKKRSRWIKRIIPVTSIRKTLSVDLEAFAKEILKPHFHSGGPPKKYAIRPSVRNNSTFNRDTVIKTVASAVGPGHRVDLKNYDLIILVDIVQNIIGMSVVGSDYDQLKRFNLAELYNPVSNEEAKEKTDSKS